MGYKSSWLMMKKWQSLSTASFAHQFSIPRRQLFLTIFADFSFVFYIWGVSFSGMTLKTIQMTCYTVNSWFFNFRNYVLIFTMEHKALAFLFFLFKLFLPSFSFVFVLFWLNNLVLILFILLGSHTFDFHWSCNSLLHYYF